MCDLLIGLFCVQFSLSYACLYSLLNTNGDLLDFKNSREAKKSIMRSEMDYDEAQYARIFISLSAVDVGYAAGNEWDLDEIEMRLKNIDLDLLSFRMDLVGWMWEIWCCELVKLILIKSMYEKLVYSNCYRWKISLCVIFWRTV